MMMETSENNRKLSPALTVVFYCLTGVAGMYVLSYRWGT